MPPVSCFYTSWVIFLEGFIWLVIAFLLNLCELSQVILIRWGGCSYDFQRSFQIYMLFQTYFPCTFWGILFFLDTSFCLPSHCFHHFNTITTCDWECFDHIFLHCYQIKPRKKILTFCFCFFFVFVVVCFVKIKLFYHLRCRDEYFLGWSIRLLDGITYILYHERNDGYKIAWFISTPGSCGKSGNFVLCFYVQ